MNVLRSCAEQSSDCSARERWFFTFALESFRALLVLLLPFTTQAATNADGSADRERISEDAQKEAVMSEMQPTDMLGYAATLVSGAEHTMAAIVKAASEVTDGGASVGEDTSWKQPMVERVVELEAAVRAARSSLKYANSLRELGVTAGPTAEAAFVYAGFAASEVQKGALFDLHGLTLPGSALHPFQQSQSLLSFANSPQHRVALGEIMLGDLRGRDVTHLGDPVLDQLRDTARQLVDRHLPVELARKIHAEDGDIPDSLICAIAEAGFFGVTIPAEHGGVGLGNLAMLTITEVLAARSLGAVGSLATRPEILTNALMRGGTPEQKALWLPQIASGEILVAIAMTEPDVGSDTSAVKCRAVPGEQNGVKGWFINGAKAWCTFAGRANVISMLIRTEDKAGGEGLSMLIVPKDSFLGHEFKSVQEGGGYIHGKADHTPGYRGMHSFTLEIANYFVSDENLIGGEAGRGNGQRFQLAGMNSGRGQTAGRALGLGQAAMEAAIRYVLERKQFGKPIADYSLTKANIGFMAAQLQAGRALAHQAAAALDAVEKASKKDGLMPAIAKFFNCDRAIEIAGRAQELHGGWGYAEEYDISRYVVDAAVLPLFEGVRPILALKAIAPVLLAA